MIRKVNAYFIASDDPDFEPGYEEVTLIDPDIIIEMNEYDKEWIFRYAKNENGRTIVDLKNGSITISFRKDREYPEILAEVLTEASFIEVIREVIKK